MGKKIDARTLELSALQLLRRQVVQAVRGGMTQTGAARTFGASLRAESTWMRLDRDGGRLNATQAARIRALIIDKIPDHFSPAP